MNPQKSKGAAIIVPAALPRAPGKKKQPKKKPKTQQQSAVPVSGKKMLFKTRALLGSSAAANVARAITLPMTYAARLPTGWENVEVATANPLNVSLQDRSTPGAGTDFWAPGGIMVGVSRDPLRHTCMTWSNATLTPWNYISKFCADTSTVGNDYIIGRQSIYLAGPETIDLHPIVFTYSSGVQAYGPQQFTCCEGGYTYVWLDAGAGAAASAVNFSLYTTPTGSTLITASTTGINARFDVIPLGEDVALGTNALFTAASGQAHVDVYASGFYRFRVTFLDAFATPQTAYGEILLYGVCSTMQFLPMPGIVARANDIQGLQVIGTAIMLSQDSATMASGGRVVGVQLEEGELPTSYIPNDFTVSLAAALERRNKFEEKQLASGMYAFHRPTKADCFSYSKPFAFNPAKASPNVTGDYASTQVVSYRSPLRPCGGWLMLAAQSAPAAAGGTVPYPGALFRFTVTCSVCIDTLSTWYHCAPAHQRVPDEEIIALLEGVPQFTENPFHMRDILSWIRRNSGVLKGLAKSGMTGLAGAFAPELLPVVSAVNALY